MSDEVTLLIDAQPQSGAWNMAADEWLLEQAISGGQAFARVYLWREPTLSLGHFQQWPVASLDHRLVGLPVVRRLSGGGAIVHDREITYSCHIPAGHMLAVDPGQLYDRVHAAISELLLENGIEVSPRGRMEFEKEQNFLCYARGDQRDLVIGSEKIVGSAQRRRKGAVLQHGSILLESGVTGHFRGLLDHYPNRFSPTSANLQRLGMKISEVLGKTTYCVLWKHDIIERISDLLPKYVVSQSISDTRHQSMLI